MVTFEKELITPAMAERYLQSNVGNRSVRKVTVLRYAKDITDGRWKSDTAETIKISKSGVVIDGQHRLHAVIKAGRPVWFHIARGMDDDVFNVIDTGTIRNASDVFKIKGIKNENKLPSIIAMYNMLTKNRRPGMQANDKSTNAVLLEQYYEDHLFWDVVARKTSRWYDAFAKILKPSILGGVYAYLAKIDQEKADEFMEQLATGINVRNNVINLLRTALMKDKVAPRKMHITNKLAIIIKTWNCYIKNINDRKIIKYDSERDKFPIAEGSL